MDPAKVSRALRGARAIKFIGSPMTRLAGTPIITWSWSVNPPIKVGDIVTCKWGSPFGVIVKVLAADKWRMIEACRVRWIDDPHGLGEEFSADLKVISRG